MKCFFSAHYKQLIKEEILIILFFSFREFYLEMQHISKVKVKELVTVFQKRPCLRVGAERLTRPAGLSVVVRRKGSGFPCLSQREIRSKVDPQVDSVLDSQPDIRKPTTSASQGSQRLMAWACATKWARKPSSPAPYSLPGPVTWASENQVAGICSESDGERQMDGFSSLSLQRIGRFGEILAVKGMRMRSRSFRGAKMR